MSGINQYEQYFLQKTSEVNYALWNAILTINGIIITAFSMAMAFSKYISMGSTKLLITLSCISMLLIIWNYISVKYHYITIGQYLTARDFRLTEKEQETEIKNSHKRYKYNLYRERISLVLLIVEILLILFIINFGIINRV